MTEPTLEQLLKTFRDKKVELALPLEQLSNLENKIKNHVRDTGETAEIEGARITVTAPKNPRVKWDTKALEGIAVMNPKILALKTEYWPAASVRIIVD